jgi:hypothetical protein
VLQAESRELLAGIARVARWTTERRPLDGDEDELAAEHRRARELGVAYERLRARDPARVDAVAAEARDYARTLRHMGVRDPWGLEIELIAPGRLLGAIAKVAVALPFAVVGAVLGWPAYHLAGEVAVRVDLDDDLLGTVKLIAGALFLFVAWTVEAVVAGALVGPPWAVPVAIAVFVGAIATGYVALRFEEMARNTSEAIRHLWIRAFHFDTARRLGDRRRALAEAVSRALRQAS